MLSRTETGLSQAKCKDSLSFEQILHFHRCCTKDDSSLTISLSALRCRQRGGINSKIISIRRTSPQKLISAYDTIHSNGSWKNTVDMQLVDISAVVKGPSISETGEPSTSKRLQKGKVGRQKEKDL